MRISDGSSDVCSCDLKVSNAAWKSRAHSRCHARGSGGVPSSTPSSASSLCAISCTATQKPASGSSRSACTSAHDRISGPLSQDSPIRSSSHSCSTPAASTRSEEHTSELQSLMRISYAVFCLKKKKQHKKHK